MSSLVHEAPDILIKDEPIKLILLLDEELTKLCWPANDQHWKSLACHNLFLTYCTGQSLVEHPDLLDELTWRGARRLRTNPSPCNNIAWTLVYYLSITLQVTTLFRGVGCHWPVTEEVKAKFAAIMPGPLMAKETRLKERRLRMYVR
jgi:hypothetical protein